MFYKKKNKIKCFYIRSSGTQEGGWGAPGLKNVFPGAVRGAELIPGSSLWPSRKGALGPVPKSQFHFSFQLLRIPFPHPSSSRGGPFYFRPGRQMTLCWTPPPPPLSAPSPPWAAADGRGTLRSLGPPRRGGAAGRVPPSPSSLGRLPAP